MKEENFEILGQHKYKVTLTGKDADGRAIPVERIIHFPYIKTSSALKIFLGTSGEFRELVKAMFTKGSVTSGGFNVDRLEILHKALDMLNDHFAGALVDAFTQVINIALDEYDDDGRKVAAGDCAMMDPEDVHKVFKIVIEDMGVVLKNVFGMEVTKPKKKNVAKLPSPTQDNQTPEAS